MRCFVWLVFIMPLILVIQAECHAACRQEGWRVTIVAHSPISPLRPYFTPYQKMVTQSSLTNSEGTIVLDSDERTAQGACALSFLGCGVSVYTVSQVWVHLLSIACLLGTVTRIYALLLYVLSTE